MGITRTWRSPSRWIVALLLIAFVTTMMVLQSGVNARSAEAGELVRVDQLALNVVYLADPTRSRLDIALVQRAGIRVIVSAGELPQLGGQAEGIMIDRSMLSLVDRDWLVAQQRAGKLIVGIDIPFSQLEESTAFPPHSVPPSYVEDWSGRAFYSLLWHVEEGNRTRSSSGSDRIYDTNALLGMVSAHLKNLREARATITTVQPTPGNPPIRPTSSPR